MLRAAAVREMEISDEGLSSKIESTEAFFEHIGSTLFEDNDSLIGHGTTSRVSSYELDGTELAVKYVVNPGQNTRSARSEHNIIREFERIRTLEALESKTHQDHPNITIPHPQFHFSDNRIQCYGMNKIIGNGFDQIISNTASEKNMSLFRESKLKDVSLEDLLNQVEAFFNTMHTYCIHGAIKADNLMVSTSGEIVVIDFGDSVLMSETEKITPEQLATNMQDEIRKTQILITEVYRKIFETQQTQEAA